MIRQFKTKNDAQIYRSIKNACIHEIWVIVGGYSLPFAVVPLKFAIDNGLKYEY